MTNEAFSRVKIDAQLRDQGWAVENPNAIRYEYVLQDGTKADYVLNDRHGRAVAVLEAKRTSVSLAEGEAQAVGYAKQLKVPFVFLANGEEVRVWEWEREAFPRVVKTIYRQDDLERRIATLTLRRDPRTIPIDNRIVERSYQHDCIDALTEQIQRGRRKMLVEMATGTGKTRTAAALIKRLFEANAVTRVLFIVDRITLANQTEDAFAEYLPDYPSYVLRSGRRFQDEKRITITTLQSMVNIYRDYSAGYFDLVFSDECHRSIYGKWRGVLEHFDGIQIGLTATPCVSNLDDNAPDEEDQAFVRDTLRFFEVDRPTYSYKLKDAIREGYLVPYQIYKAKTVKTAAEGGFPVARKELDWTAMDAGTRAEFEELFANEGDPITVDPSALERRFTIPERNRAMVREFKDVLTRGYIDSKGIQRKPLLGKTIVFAVTKRHAETLVKGVNEKRTKPAQRPSYPGPSARKPSKSFPGTKPTDSPTSTAYIPKLKRASSDVEKRRFMKGAFDAIQAHFRAALDELAQHSDIIECDFQPNSAIEFTAEVFLGGKSTCFCRIWQGGLLSSDGISYAEGHGHYGNNSCNESLTVADDRGELHLSSLMGMGFSQIENLFDLKRMSQQQAANYLWRRFVAPLER